MTWKNIFSQVLPFKEPKERLPGYLTQFKGVTENDPKQLLIIGLDFGTAFTKVVIGEARVNYAVPFHNHSDRKNIYLLPGILSIYNNGDCLLGKQKDVEKTITDMKMELIQGNKDITCQIYIVAFMALVFKYVREWLLNEHKNTYRGKYLDWYINVGLPTDNYDDDELSNIYRNIVETAWLISTFQSAVNISTIKEQLDQDKINLEKVDLINNEATSLHPDKIELFPEFAAQVYGYVRSPSRQPDLHALFDVGAGTLDMTIFNVHEHDNEQIYPIFAKSVKPYGVQFLFFHRLKDQFDTNVPKPNAFEEPPSKNRFAKILKITIDQLNTIDSSFREKILTEIDRLFRYTKERRYKRSQRWITGVPFFLCGGGAEVDFYNEIFEQLQDDGATFRIKKIKLPQPERLIAPKVSDKYYDRLSVAYGLSFDALDIGEIRPPSEVKDDDDCIQNDIGKDKKKICQKCNGLGGTYYNCSECGGSGWV